METEKMNTHNNNNSSNKNNPSADESQGRHFNFIKYQKFAMTKVSNMYHDENNALAKYILLSAAARKREKESCPLFSVILQ